MKREDALRQIDQTLVLAASIREDDRPGDDRGSFVTSALLSLIEKFSLPGSTYREQLRQLIKKAGESYPGYLVPQIVGVVRSIRHEVENGSLSSITEVVHADTFSGFLDMASHLLSEGYKDPAAVLAGSVLEQHLRTLAMKSGVENSNSDGRWKKAELLNADLVKAGAYTSLEQKSVTSWLGLRNEAAHGHFGKYETANVRLMIDGISLFVSQHPA